MRTDESTIITPGTGTRGQPGIGKHPRVIERLELRASDVLEVAEGRALALVVPHYYSRESCRIIADRLLAASELWTTYPAGSGAEHIGTLGSALYNCLGEELSEDCVSYFDMAPSRNRALRAVTAPMVNPADRVRIDMDNDWPAGATLLRVDGRPAFFGLCRYVQSGGMIGVILASYYLVQMSPRLAGENSVTAKGANRC